MGSVRIQPGGDLSEIARLMEVFNQATEKLSRSYAHIADLQKEVAEKDRELHRKTRLETLGRMAANLAHEIRNPLGGIQLYASMLRRDLAGDPPKVQTVDRILTAVAGLNSLVEDMLAFGRDQEPQRRPTRLANLVESALDLAGTSLEKNGVEVEQGINGDRVTVDPEMIRRVFLNIVLNAAQAMESGGRLRIEGDAAEIRFTDTGPGIPPEILEKLFTPFVTGKAKGTGLGLAIARKIVEAHGGTIGAFNNPEGGATFVVKL